MARYVGDRDEERVAIGEPYLAIVAADLFDRRVTQVDADAIVVDRAGQKAPMHLGGQVESPLQVGPICP